MAHRLVKRLYKVLKGCTKYYKLTNKRNTAKQIGTLVRRMEMTQHAFHRQRLREKQYAHLSSSQQLSDAVVGDSDLRYFVSPSQTRNVKVDICQLLKTHRDYPAYKVNLYC